jgi:hypothetical protein
MTEQVRIKPFATCLLAAGLVAGGLTATSLATAVGAQATLDVSRAEDALKADRRMQCSLEDGKPVTFWWRGGVMSRVPGEQDRHIFNVEGMNIRACATVTDPKRGYGYKMVSRELLIYLDPQTNQVLKTWKNPWTGAENEVIHVANDPVNSGPTHAMSAKGEAYQWRGRRLKGRMWQQFEVPLFYPNPLGGEYQEFVGGTYHATELFDFFAEEADLLNPAGDPTSVTIAWGRISQWLPWMNMGDRPGMLVFTTAGKRLNNPANLTAVLKSEIAKNYPVYTQPPPMNDTRPNMTSWIYFKQMLDKRKPAGK